MNLRKRLWIASLVGIFGATIAVSPAAAQFSKEELKCRGTIVKSGTKLAKTIAKVTTGCHKSRAVGKIPSGTDCNTLATADTKDKASKAADKFRDAVGGVKDKCVGILPADLGYGTCPAPCDAAVPTITTFSDVSDCVICLQETLVVDMTAASQGTPTPTLSKIDAKCHATIGKNQAKLVATIIKERTKCQGTAEKQGVSSGTAGCSLSDLNGKIDTARTKATAAISSTCAQADLIAVDSCETADVGLLPTCVTDDADMKGEELFQSYYGAIAPTWTAVTDIFVANGCAGSVCHGAAGGGGISDIADFTNGYNELLTEGVQCGSSSFASRVVPNDPGASFLIAKLTGTHDCGSAMPIGGTLSPADLDLITAWILDGAPQN